MAASEIYVACPRCEAEIEIECDIETGETYTDMGLSCWSYDYAVPDLPPDRCPEGCEWTDEEKAELEARIEKAAEEWGIP